MIKNNINEQWSQIRAPWQKHIIALYELIDEHSKLCVSSGDLFHKISYEILTQYLHSLKDHIKQQEKALLTKE